MKYWYDTEFYEDGSTIDLISIGIVAEDGREFYRQNREFDWSRVPDQHWLWDNVYPHLKWSDYDPGVTWGTKSEIAHDVQYFITAKGHDNELWGYYSSYDHVVLAQLFGRMVDMPYGVPWFTQDIRQVKAMLKAEGWDYEFPKQESVAHNALNDARWTKQAYEHIMKFAHGEEEW